MPGRPRLQTTEVGLRELQLPTWEPLAKGKSTQTAALPGLQEVVRVGWRGQARARLPGRGCRGFGGSGQPPGEPPAVGGLAGPSEAAPSPGAGWLWPGPRRTDEGHCDPPFPRRKARWSVPEVAAASTACEWAAGPVILGVQPRAGQLPRHGKCSPPNLPAAAGSRKLSHSRLPPERPRCR